ncbi:MAG: hypothetical protein ACJAZM_000673 [Cyclobacteriaceae bacterium]|jgi:hypothetical protein
MRLHIEGTHTAESLLSKVGFFCMKTKSLPEKSTILLQGLALHQPLPSFKSRLLAVLGMQDSETIRKNQLN